MPPSNFYWDTSSEAMKREEKGESTYTLNRPTGRGWRETEIPFPPLNSFIHLFVLFTPALIFLPVSQHLILMVENLVFWDRFIFRATNVLFIYFYFSDQDVPNLSPNVPVLLAVCKLPALSALGIN